MYRKNWIPLLVPNMPMPGELMPWLETMHQSKSFSNFGPLARELEKQIAKKFEVPSECIATVANATLGLELVLKALDLPKNSKVIVPAFTFVATAVAVINCGHQPVLVDVDKFSWLLKKEIVLEICKSMDIDAVIPVAAFGMPQNISSWARFEEETGIPVVIDAAGAYGSQWLNKCAGTLVFSMHATKSLPAGEGGIVVSSDKNISNKVRELSNFGINLNGLSDLPLGQVLQVGTNAKMSEYHAAVALASLVNWDKYAKLRKELYLRLIEEINSVIGGSCSWQSEDDGGSLNAPTLLPILLESEALRDLMEKKLFEQKITTRRWYQPILTRQKIISEHSIDTGCPNAEYISKRLLGLPFYLEMNNLEIDEIVDSIDLISKSMRPINGR